MHPVLPCRLKMIDDVVTAKVSSVERCLRRIAEIHGGSHGSLEEQTKQDAIILNLQRACQVSIDLAMHLVAARALGVPQESRDAFSLLEGAGLLDPALSMRLKAMVGFRNLAIHDYQAPDLEILRRIIDQHLDDFRRFVAVVRTLLAEST